MGIDDKLKEELLLHTLAMEEQQKTRARLLGESDYFNRILEMNTEAERRRIASESMYAMLSNGTYAQSFRVTDIAELAVSATDALIVELNKKKDENN